MKNLSSNLKMLSLFFLFSIYGYGQNQDEKKDKIEEGVDSNDISKLIEEIYGKNWKEFDDAIYDSIIKKYKNFMSTQKGFATLPASECQELMEAAYGKNWRKNRSARYEYFYCRSVPDSGGKGSN